MREDGEKHILTQIIKTKILEYKQKIIQTNLVLNKCVLEFVNDYYVLLLFGILGSEHYHFAFSCVFLHTIIGLFILQYIPQWFVALLVFFHYFH